MTDEWVCVIPQRCARKGIAKANSAGMLGLVWLKDQAERDAWTKFSLTEHLAYLGFPVTST